MELSDNEIELIDNMLDDLFDEMCHYPDDYSEVDRQTYDSLRTKVRDEAKRRGFWWAR